MIDLNAIKAAPEKLIEVARDLWNAERLNPQARICEALAEELIEVVPFIERLQSELTAAHEQLGYNAKPNDSQEWARISGAVAHQLIERHADDWREAGDMMEAFAASRAAARPAVVLSDQTIIELENLELHALNFRWAGDAEEICVFGHAVAAAAHQEPAYALLAKMKQAPVAASSRAEDGSVAMPDNADQAALMVLLGTQWLEQYAPERLKAPAAQPEAKAAPVAALTNGNIRSILHCYSRLVAPGHYSDTEFDCLQDVIGFVRACLAAAGNSQGQAAQPKIHDANCWQNSKHADDPSSHCDCSLAAQPEQQPVADVGSEAYPYTRALADIAVLNPTMLEFALQLIGAAPCKDCGFIKTKCHCHSADAEPVPAAAPEPLQGWQPIETAPLDGSHVWCYAPELQFAAFYAGPSGWCYVAPGVPVAPTQPTHWMSLAAAPVGGSHGKPD